MTLEIGNISIIEDDDVSIRYKKLNILIFSNHSLQNAYVLLNVFGADETGDLDLTSDERLKIIGVDEI